MKKLKILVPVDFSQTSFAAYMYAVQLARDIGAIITLYYVQVGSFSTNDISMSNPLLEDEDEDEDEINEQLEYFATDHPKKIGVDIPTIYTKLQNEIGVPRYAIVNKAKLDRYDLIVIGTRDKTSIFDKILGRTSKYVIAQSDCPVIAIHKDTPYNKIESTVFGIDDQGGIRDNIQAFDRFNRIIKSFTAFIHVSKESEYDILKILREITDEIFEYSDPPYGFEIKNITGDEIVTSLIDYAIFNKADLLVMVHRQQGILDRLIHGSTVNKLNKLSHLPLMVLNNKK